MLVAVNVWTIVIAIISDTPLRTLMLAYWIQSVVIGYYSRRRILELRRFSTEGFTIIDKPVDPTATKRWTANFFALQYGFFHFTYLLFLLGYGAPTVVAGLQGLLRNLTLYNWAGLGVAAVSFVWNHRASFEHNAVADRRGTPSIGTLMGLPYLRILPMLVGISFVGVADVQGVIPLLSFGVLKTGADVFMHTIEHRVLQTGWSGIRA
ncbi:MAG: DUF6498-containing protein [Candidatus Rokuibacteriota bacterium]